MPLQLTTPIDRPAITTAEIVYFNVDLLAMTVLIGFAYQAADGTVIKTFEASAKLADDNGQPRFTTDEYGSIKGALYRIALEDGIVSGTVE